MAPISCRCASDRCRSAVFLLQRHTLTKLMRFPLFPLPCSRVGQRMTTRERLFLTPIEKFKKYGVVPWKLILNVVLVVLVTGQVRATGDEWAHATPGTGPRCGHAAAPCAVWRGQALERVQAPPSWLAHRKPRHTFCPPPSISPLVDPLHQQPGVRLPPGHEPQLLLLLLPLRLRLLGVRPVPPASRGPDPLVRPHFSPRPRPPNPPLIPSSLARAAPSGTSTRSTTPWPRSSAG
jgi:hypothetical protein